MKKILIVAPYCSLPGELKFNRFMQLAEMLSKEYSVTLVTSSFRHFDKKQRCLKDSYCSQPYDIKLIDETGYNNNVSFKRLYSHYVFCTNFKSWFKKEGMQYDLVYSAYPLIETNVFLGKIKNEFDFKFIVDVQDVWPEAISAAFPIFKNLPLKLVPFTKKANRAYAGADGIVAVSETYMRRACMYNDIVNNEVVYIGSDFDKIKKAKRNESTGFKLIYIGSLGHSYDLSTIIKSVNKLSSSGYDITFDIFGGGLQEEELKKISSDAIQFHGFIPYELMLEKIKSSSVGVNCLKVSAPQSVTNKLSDYMSIGIPILNGHNNKEVLDLLSVYSDHENYVSQNEESATLAIKRLYDRRAELEFNSAEVFNRSVSYCKIKSLVGFLLECN